MDKAVAIRNRARRRIGELLNGVKPVAGVKIPRGGYATNGRTAVAKSFGISGSERKTAMRLAAMPKAEFDRRETDPDLGNVRGSKVASATLDQVIKCPHCGKRIII
jgi:hypothetical protein